MDDIARTSGLLLPGGKVDAEAIRRALEQAEQTGVDADDDAELRTVTFTLQRDLNKRLDKYLTDRITFMSRNQLQKLIGEGGVTVNGRVAKSSTNLRAGDEVEVVIPPPPSKDIVPENIPLDVMYEDEHLLVINKQPDIIVHPARSHLKGTMLSALAWHFQHGGTGLPTGAASPKLSSVGAEFARPGVVHRLDRHTSGCIVFAKQDEAHWKLGHQFEYRTVDKRYMAVVHGKVEPPIEVVELPIGPHPSREKGYREKYVVRHDELGKHAVTIYRVRERYVLENRTRTDGTVGDEWFSLVELELKTGRTHQIRVHLSELGYPIVGDDMYGGRPFVDPATGEPIIARQALHATILGFKHPITEQPMQFTAPLRGDIGRLVRTLHQHSGSRLERLAPPGATVDIAKVLPP
ncbi:MAG TPA: RluA family pseudouridine synthase [Phycisphaerales bacterium]|nr:RluA family pseudouridine synthase [Phycisphaerales bacterium]